MKRLRNGAFVGDVVGSLENICYTDWSNDMVQQAQSLHPSLIESGRVPVCRDRCSGGCAASRCCRAQASGVRLLVEALVIAVRVASALAFALMMEFARSSGQLRDLLPQQGIKAGSCQSTLNRRACPQSTTGNSKCESYLPPV